MGRSRGHLEMSCCNEAENNVGYDAFDVGLRDYLPAGHRDGIAGLRLVSLP